MYKEDAFLVPTDLNSSEKTRLNLVLITTRRNIITYQHNYCFLFFSHKPLFKDTRVRLNKELGT